ncbi:MAG TPA: galactokinase [Aggregatilineales bacterium]|nr:galactokinase [Aggregatilineales bacterium]
MSLQQRVIDAFQRKFGAPPAIVVRAPGRVNLIGEHTDYNDGFVLPMAIDRAAWIALRPRTDRRLVVQSLDFDQSVDVDLNQMTNTGPGWAEYLKGVAWALTDSGKQLEGWEGVTAGDVPIGAGLSSSAALELATARAFATVSQLDWNPAQMALLSQRAENKWVGVNCGIMDQMISAAGAAGHALLIDCRSLENQLVPLPPGNAVIVLDTATRRGLVDSAYNERRAQCEAAARFFNVKALRDVSVAQFEARAAELDEVTRRRARHVVTENDRTLKAAEVMRAGDAAALGLLMNASHDSLRDDFEVTNSALNVIVEIARQQPGCWGARMTGAGFGGCAVALVKAEAATAFDQAVTTAYTQATGLTPNVYICHASDGASVVP